MKILSKTAKFLKIKAILLCAALILCCVNVFGQSITWERTYLRSNWTSGYSIKQTSDGNYITCGLRTNYGGFVLKLNRYGDTLWVRYFPVAEFTSIIETIDGKYVAIGWTDFVHIVKLDTNGNNIWARQIIEPGYETRAYHICLTNDGGFAIAGEAKSNNPTILSGYFLKLDSTGFKIWSKVIYKTNTNIVLSGVKEIIPAGFILTGGELYNNNLQIIVIKTLLNGDTLWTKSFGTNYDERGYAIFQTNDNGFLSIGQIYLSGGQRRLYFTKTDSTGILLWSKIYGDTLTTYELRSSDCAVYNPYSNSYLITGRYVSGVSSLDTTKLFIVSVDTSGNRIWDKFYYKDTADIEGASIDICNDSGYIIAGDLLDPPIDNILTSPQYLYAIKTNKDGEIQPIGINNQNISLPKYFKLNPVYPNPFNPETNITFEVPKASNIKINLYNILGKEVKILINNTLKSGIYNLKLESGELASGIYFVSMFADNNLINTQKIILIK